jgi:protein-tyrosine-phosphatase
VPSGKTVLFVCPHGAAKSVLAGSYFNLLAERRGLTVRAVSCGTEPDPEISERVRADVAANGAVLCTNQPTLMTRADAAEAELLVTFDLSESELGVRPHRTWDRLPALSEEFEQAKAEILTRVESLVAEFQV